MIRPCGDDCAPNTCGTVMRCGTPGVAVAGPVRVAHETPVLPPVFVEAIARGADLLDLFEVDGARQMQLVVEEGVAAGEADVVVLAVLLLRDARGVFRLDPFELAVQHEVDDARDGVGTVGRRGAAGDDVDALA